MLNQNCLPVAFTALALQCFASGHSVPSTYGCRDSAGRGDFDLEVLPAGELRRIAIAQIPGAVTLEAASAAVAGTLRHRGGFSGQLLGRDRMGPTTH